MPRGLDSADRKLLIGAGIVFAVLAIVSALVTPAQLSGASQAPSTYSASWYGAKGAYLLLQKLGYNVTRWERSPTDLPFGQRNDVLILADPSETPSEEERYAIIDFLEDGGRVIATGAAAADFLPEKDEFTEGDVAADTSSFDAVTPSPFVRGAPQITMTRPDSWSPQHLSQTVLYGDAQTAAVLTYPVGKGRVIWWAAPTPLTNGAIRDAGNLAFFLNCVGTPGFTHVFWDEYFHGVRGTLLNFFARTPVLWGAAQVGLVFLAILVTHSRRLGPIRAPAVPSRLSPLEFVDTLGDLYSSADVSAAAVAIAYQRFRFMLTRKLGVPIDVPSPELTQLANESLGWQREPLLQTLEQCDVAAQNKDGRIANALDLVQRLHDYATRLEVKRDNTAERKQDEQS
jgi:hypothetical protein